MSESAANSPKKPAFIIGGCVDTTFKNKTYEAKLRRVLFRHVPHVRNMLILLRRSLREVREDNPALSLLSSNEQCRDWLYGRQTYPKIPNMLLDKPPIVTDDYVKKRENARMSYNRSID